MAPVTSPLSYARAMSNSEPRFPHVPRGACKAHTCGTECHEVTKSAASTGCTGQTVAMKGDVLEITGDVCTASVLGALRKLLSP